MDPIVTTTAGAVRGTWEGGSARFYSIPYAEAPVGELRLRPSVARRSWEGTRDATHPGATPQRQIFGPEPLVPEPSIPGDDILNVSVFTPEPRRRADGGLPVLVWIHGGGFFAGSPVSPWYDGRSFNRDGVVVVSLSYRLGFDGFGWVPGIGANRALGDWVLGLEWVRENIAGFGGDPDAVTIAGQSAGGGAVLTLMAMPAARGLFHRAISISGAPADIPQPVAEATAAQVAGRLGVEASWEALAEVPEDALIAAQGSGFADAKPVDEFLAAQARPSGTGLLYGPVVDGDLLPRAVREAFADGVAAETPLLAGSTRDEFSMVTLGYRDDLAGAGATEVLQRIGFDSAFVERYASQLADAGIHDGIGALARIGNDRMFRSLVVDLVRRRGDAPTWVYDFAWVSPVVGQAWHCLDLPFLFDVLDEPHVARLGGPHPPQELADEVHAAAVAFIRDGSPGWRPSTADDIVVHTYGAAPDAAVGYATAATLLERDTQEVGA